MTIQVRPIHQLIGNNAVLFQVSSTLQISKTVNIKLVRAEIPTDPLKTCDIAERSSPLSRFQIPIKVKSIESLYHPMSSPALTYQPLLAPRRTPSLPIAM